MDGRMFDDLYKAVILVIVAGVLFGGCCGAGIYWLIDRYDLDVSVSVTEEAND